VTSWRTQGAASWPSDRFGHTKRDARRCASLVFLASSVEDVDKILLIEDPPSRPLQGIVGDEYFVLVHEDEFRSPPCILILPLKPAVAGPLAKETEPLVLVHKCRSHEHWTRLDVHSR